MAQCCTNTITPKMIRTGQMQIGDRILLEDIPASVPASAPASAPASEPASAPEQQPASAPEPTYEPAAASAVQEVSVPVSEPAAGAEPASSPVSSEEPPANSVLVNNSMPHTPTDVYQYQVRQQAAQNQSMQNQMMQNQMMQHQMMPNSQMQQMQQPQAQIPQRFTTPLTTPLTYQQMTQYLDQNAINTQGSQPSITLPQTPMTTLEFTETIDVTDVQSYIGFLRTQIGRYMRVEQLMGSNNVENRYGFLVGIGSNFIILQEITTGNIMVIDLFTIRLTYIYYSDPVVPPEFPR